MQIKQIMTANPKTVTSITRLGVVKDIYDEVQFHHLLVIEDNQLVGVVSDRDLYKVISPYADSPKGTKRDNMTLDLRVTKIMSRDIISLSEDETIMRAVHLFNTHLISCLPVVDEGNRPVGIVSWRDVMQYLEQRVMQNFKHKMKLD